jgi:hypothetical protein
MITPVGREYRLLISRGITRNRTLIIGEVVG